MFQNRFYKIILKQLNFKKQFFFADLNSLKLIVGKSTLDILRFFCLFMILINIFELFEKLFCGNNKSQVLLNIFFGILKYLQFMGSHIIKFLLQLWKLLINHKHNLINIDFLFQFMHLYSATKLIT